MRWVRQLIGFAGDGRPHWRIEQRVLPAGPTVIDMFANAALYYGAVHMLARERGPAEARLPFDIAKANFYTAARHGMDASIAWFGGEERPVRAVIDELCTTARDGLERHGIENSLIDRYLDIVASRTASGRNGAAWQLAHHRRHGGLFRLTADYLEHQRSGMPVHQWPV
ncbi:MAG: hypothetical protein DI636_11585 [Pelagerythrobacter marensis]|nr:MAG: hypothetical protein DI636_11585 [Pelagerythrobacter marensis]